jgi:hypothetical protein
VRGERTLDARAAVLALDVAQPAQIARALDWRDRPAIRARLRISAEASVKPSELAAALELGEVEIARLGLVSEVDLLAPPAPRPVAERPATPDLSQVEGGA